MKVNKFENVYTHCAVNCYPHCLDVKHELVCFASRNSVAFYDLDKRKVVAICCQHKDMVNSVRWIADSADKHLISSSVDKTCVIWERTVTADESVDYGAKLVLAGHTDSVIVADSVWDNNTTSFISISSCNDKVVRYWKNDSLVLSKDVKSFIFDIKIYANLTLIPGLVIITTGSNELVTIQRFNVTNSTVESLISLKGHGDWIKTIDLCQFGENIFLASGSQDFIIRVYNIKPAFENNQNNLHEQSFSLKEETLSNSGSTTESAKVFAVSLETVLCSHEGWVTEVKWHLSQENKLYLLSSSMDKTIILWEPLDDIWNEAVRFGEVGGNAIGFFGCNSIPKRNQIVGYSFNGAVSIWQKQQSDRQWATSVPITGHFNEVTDLCWEPKGEYFLTCSADQTTRLHSHWKSALGPSTTWHEVGRPQVHGYDLKCIAMAGRLKFASGADEKVIRVFSATKYFIDSLMTINSSSPEGGDHSFFEGSEEEGIAECAVVPALGLSNSAVYDTSQMTDEQLKPRALTGPPTEEVLFQNTLWPEVQKLYGHGYELFALAVNRKGTLLASACKAATATHAAVILWDFRSCKILAHLPSHSLTVTQVRFSPDDRLLLSVSRDRTWALFDVSTAATTGAGEFPRVAFSDKRTGVHSRIIWDCAWTPDSRAFLTSSRDKSVVIWRIEEEKSSGGGDDEGAAAASSALQVTSLPAVLTLDESVTSVDVHGSLCDPYLCCLGLENGHLLLYSFNLTGVGDCWSLLCSFDRHCHTHVINRVRFSPKTVQSKEHRTAVVQLASCSSDRAVKLFEVELDL